MRFKGLGILDANSQGFQKKKQVKKQVSITTPCIFELQITLELPTKMDATILT